MKKVKLNSAEADAITRAIAEKNRATLHLDTIMGSVLADKGIDLSVTVKGIEGNELLIEDGEE